MHTFVSQANKRVPGRAARRRPPIAPLPPALGSFEREGRLGGASAPPLGGQPSSRLAAIRLGCPFPPEPYTGLPATPPE